MSETIRYGRIGREDINFGSGTFEVRLANGCVVTLSQVDIGAILSDASLSSQSVSLTTLTLTTLTVSGVLSVTGTLRAPEKADPGSPVSGELWINSGGTVLEYADDVGPTTHALVGHDTTQTLTNKTLTAPAIASPVLSGTATGTYSLGGTPTIASPTITSPTITGTTTIGAGATLTEPTIDGVFTLQEGQLAFPATQNNSGDAHVLDDYEEGEWTPSVGGTATYTLQRGQHVKIGRQVTIICNLSISSIGTGSTSIISGVPFVNSTAVAVGPVSFGGLSANVTTMVAVLSGGTSAVTLFSLAAAGDTLVANARLTDNTAIQFSLTYFTAT